MHGEDTDLYREPPSDLKGHVLFGGGGKTVGLITADAPRFPAKIQGGNEALVYEMNKMGLKHEATYGSYGGRENSFIIHNPSRTQMRHLASSFGQEAFVYGSGGTHELHYALGPNAGKFSPSLPTMRYSKTQPEDFYTHVPGKGYLSLDFDHDRLNNAPVEPAEIKKALREALYLVLRKST
jgi:hypothetical protein